MTEQEQALPPLPEPSREAEPAGYMPGCPTLIEATPDYYTADQMHAYARATLAATPAPAPAYNDATELALGKAYRTIAIDRPWLSREDFEAAYRAGQAATPAPAEPYAHIVELPSEYSGLTKFFTAPSDPRGFPVYRRPPVAATPAQAQQAHWTPEQVLRTQEIAAELKAKIKHKPLTDEQLRKALTGSECGHITDTVRGIAADTQRACAEAWGVKLGAGIGASTGEAKP